MYIVILNGINSIYQRAFLIRVLYSTYLVLSSYIGASMSKFLVQLREELQRGAAFVWVCVWVFATVCVSVRYSVCVLQIAYGAQLGDGQTLLHWFIAYNTQRPITGLPASISITWTVLPLSLFVALSVTGTNCRQTGQSWRVRVCVEERSRVREREGSQRDL